MAAELPSTRRGQGEWNDLSLCRLLFVFLQWRKRDLCFPRIRAVHGFAAMAQGELRKAFRVSDHLGPFRPRVTVAVQRDTLYSEAGATLLELSRAVAGLHVAQIRKQGPHL